MNTSQRNLFQCIFTHIRSHGVRGTAQRALGEERFISVVAEQAIEAGTSGGPIVNEDGELVGIVSNGTYTSRCPGLSPWLNLALPVWVCRRAREFDSQED